MKNFIHFSAKKAMLLSLVVLPFQAYSQYSLERATTFPRSGDRLVKQPIVYQTPGTVGTNLLWDFSNLKGINKDYELKYMRPNQNSDTIVGIEHRTMYYYTISHDSLLSLGYENPTTLISYQKPETILLFPFPYGQSITDYFNGAGTYCNRLDIRVQGKSIVKADAAGAIILPGGDTLHNVLRVYTQKRIIEQTKPLVKKTSLNTDTLPFVWNRDSIDWHLTNDSAYLQINIWRWYAKGYRYPVFESVENLICTFGKPYPYSSVSFYYPPHEQHYALNTDMENQQIRNVLTESKYSIADTEEKNIGHKYTDGQIGYQITLSSQNILYVEYTLKTPTNVAIGLYDLQGHQLSHIYKQQCVEGSYSETIRIKDFPAGEYLLRLIINGKNYSEKIIKL